jgi:hypothetical protein
VIAEILVTIVFFATVALYVLYRVSSSYHRPPLEESVTKTSSEKLFDSKAYDATFFDGESEQYAEAMSRLRTYGGA